MYKTTLIYRKISKVFNSAWVRARSFHHACYCKLRKIYLHPWFSGGMRLTFPGRFRVDLKVPRVVPSNLLLVGPEGICLGQTVLNNGLPSWSAPHLIPPVFIFPQPNFTDLYFLWLLCCLHLDPFHLHLGQDPAIGLKGSVFISCSTSAS